MKNKIMNLPNKITILRVILIPIFVASLYLKMEYAREIAVCVFLVASITDAIDGWIARKYNLVTTFGKLIDPIADKLLTFSAFIMLAHMHVISPVAVIVIMARELLVNGIRMVSAESGTVISASFWGKLKTVSQCVAILLLLLWERISFTTLPFDQIILWISVGITVLSGVDYVAKYIKQAKFDR